jgi:hypothetical protein
MLRSTTGPPKRWLLGLLLLVAAGGNASAAIDETKLPPASNNQVDFLRDIKPLFDAHCLKCHGPEKPKSNFRVDMREALLKGGENGVAVIPGQSAKSPLIHFVSGLVADMEMPPKGKGEPLTPATDRLAPGLDRSGHALGRPTGTASITLGIRSRAGLDDGARR